MGCNGTVSKLLFAGLASRLLLLVWGQVQDYAIQVKYTDIDYYVYSDAAQAVFTGSPFDRATYRYSPLLACLLVGNTLIHADFGKLLFSVLDVVAAW